MTPPERGQLREAPPDLFALMQSNEGAARRAGAWMIATNPPPAGAAPVALAAQPPHGLAAV